MSEFLLGVLASILASAIIAIIVKWIWPNLKDKCLYDGVRIAGAWDITELRNGKNIKVGKIELIQQGRIVKGTSTRTKTRDGTKSERKFHYHGFINGNSVHDKFHRTLILSGFCLLKIAKISLNSSFFPKPIKR
ncbi:hypothetical protein ABLT74_06060, partial [Acinetobacter johnsonii]